MTNPGVRGGRAMLELAERVEKLGSRKYNFDPPVAAVLRRHEPGGLTGHDWSDREAFTQAIELVKLAPEIAAALRARAADTPSVKP